MNTLITKEINAQIVISLLKAHGIRKIVASPGATNNAFVGSVQEDPFFEIYSSVDERSAAYIACGLSEESGEPVVISCTGATASRNYVPGLTEAYYRKLPIIALTSTQAISNVGHLVAQVIDRNSIQNDIAKLSVSLPIVKDSDDIWDCEVKVNRAILETKRRGGGPVHINLPTTYTFPFNRKALPTFRVIERIISTDDFPSIEGKVAVFVGSHKKWTQSEIEAIDKFCATNDAVVFCDHTSGYKGKYRVSFSIAAAQEMMDKSPYQPDILIHIGEISGDYASLGMAGKEVWRVSDDGEIRDTFRKLRYTFEMSEKSFFEHYIKDEIKDDQALKSCKARLNNIRSQIPELHFSNIWVASQLAHKIPDASVLHLGILNTLRSWNFFDLPETVHSTSNVGGFGIDGIISSLIGASLNDLNRLCFCVLGDLAFFYDMNVLGNRHVENNVRILLINNGKGTEFRQYNHHSAYFGDAADGLIAAAGHFGNKSSLLVKQYVETLGFEYICASDKEEFNIVYGKFVNPEITERPIVFEVFTDSDDESSALKTILNIATSKRGKAKKFTKKFLGKSGEAVIRKIIKR